MSITTITHRHHFDLPQGYVCKTPRHQMEQIADACIVECGGRSTKLDFDNGRWSVYLTTDPLDANTLAIIDRKLSDLFTLHRKTP